MNAVNLRLKKVLDGVFNLSVLVSVLGSYSRRAGSRSLLEKDRAEPEPLENIFREPELVNLFRGSQSR